MFSTYARSAAALAVLAALALAGAPVAAGSAGPATLTVALDRGAAVRDCVTLPVHGRRCGALGMTAVSAAWTASCGDAAPSSSSVELRRQSGAAPASTDVVVDQVQTSGTSGRERFVVEPGQRVYALARAICDPGDTALEPSEDSAASPPLTIAPALLGYVIMENRICGFPRASMQTTLQARNWAELLFFPRFARDSAILAKADLSRITLSAIGAGVALTARPNARIFTRYGDAGLRVTARSGGSLRIHATIDGMRTPSRTVRVLPPRRACAGSPRR